MNFLPLTSFRVFSCLSWLIITEILHGCDDPQYRHSASALPEWAKELITLYESDSANQFILYGNVNDRLVLPLGAAESWDR